MEENKIKRTGKYDSLFYKILPQFLNKPNVIFISTNREGAPFGFKGTLTDFEPYDYIVIDNKSYHFIDNNDALLFIGYYDENNKSTHKVKTLYKPGLAYQLKTRFTSEKEKVFLGYQNNTEDSAVIFDQEKILGYSVKKEQMQKRYNDIGKPVDFPRQYIKK